MMEKALFDALRQRLRVAKAITRGDARASRRLTIKTLMTEQNNAIPVRMSQPNAETIAAFNEIETGSLNQFDSVDALFAELNQ